MRLPSLSLPWAILSSVIVIAIVVLLALHIVSWPVLAAFIGGVVIPAVRSGEGPKVSPPPLPVLFLLASLFVVVCMTVVMACAPTAKGQYGLQLQSCIDQAKNRAEADACIHTIQLEWDEAGAPPALVFVKDGGAE